MAIELFLLIGSILNLIAFIVCLLLIDDIRIFAFIIFLFIPYTFTIGSVSMGIVWLIDKIRQ